MQLWSKHVIARSDDTVLTAEIMHAFAISIRTVPFTFSQVRPHRSRWEPAHYSREQILARLRELNGCEVAWPVEPLLRVPEAAALIRASGRQMAAGTLTHRRCTGRSVPSSIIISARGTTRYERAAVLAWIASESRRYTPRRQRASYVATLRHL